MLLLRLELQPLGLGAAGEREAKAVGEEGEREGVGVVGEEEEVGDEAVGVPGEDRLLGSGREDARCSRRRRRWRRVEERSSASALSPEADRLTSRALAWLEEGDRGGFAPSWGYFLRPGANAAAGEATRPEKSPVLILERIGSILPPVLLVPKAFRWSGDTGERRGGGRR